MDMKKILQALDGVKSKPSAGSTTDMKKFLSIVTEGKDTKTNRLSTAEQIAFEENNQPRTVVKTNPVLNKPLKNETLIKSYVEQVLAEQAAELEAKKAEIKERAARVVKNMREGIKVTKVDPGAKTISYTDDATNVTTTVPQTMAKPQGGKVAVDKTLTSPGGADDQGSEIKPGMDVEISELSPELLRRAAQARHKEKIKNIASTMFQDPKDPKIAKLHHKMAQREKGAERTRSRFDKQQADATAKAKAERDAAIKDKYAGIDIDAEIAKLKPAIQSAYHDYQYGARNTWSQGKSDYDRLISKVKELEYAKKVMGEGFDIGEGDE